MRLPRVKAIGHGLYHCFSRAVHSLYIFRTTGHGSVEAERFVELMRRTSAFSGVRILEYVLMSNHFHLVCEVPEPVALSESEVLARIEAGFGRGRRKAVQKQLDGYRKQPDRSAQIERVLDRYRKRMYDLSIFIKELKGRFAQWYNKRHGRYGALWAERFKSLLVEAGEAVVHQVRDWYTGAAAYFGWMCEAKRENTRCGLRPMSDKAAGRKTRGPKGCDESGPTAALLLGHVSIQICSLVAPCRHREGMRYPAKRATPACNIWVCPGSVPLINIWVCPPY
jgi:hypothetical protein